MKIDLKLTNESDPETCLLFDALEIANDQGLAGRRLKRMFETGCERLRNWEIGMEFEEVPEEPPAPEEEHPYCGWREDYQHGPR